MKLKGKMASGSTAKRSREYNSWDDAHFLRLFENFRLRPHLWRKSEEDYLNFEKRQLGMEEIASDLGCSVPTVKAAWKAMRDNYRREMRIVENDAAYGRPRKIKWRFYDALDYLSEVYVKSNDFDFFTILCSIDFFGKSDATIDLSGVDLSKFQYFKNNVEAKMMAKAQKAMQLLAPLTDKIEKAKAVVTYFKNVALGNPEHNEEQIIEFDPHFGEAWQPHYENHFGPRGAHLIEVLGHGHSPRELHRYGALHRKSIEY